MKKSICLPKKTEMLIYQKQMNANTWGKTVLKILIYL